MEVSNKVIQRWADVMGPTLAESDDPEHEVAAMDSALALDGNPGQRLGMWLALLERPTAQNRREALLGIGRVLADVDSIRTNTAIMLFARLAADQLWHHDYAVDVCLAITFRVARLNPETRRDVVTYALEVLAQRPNRTEAYDLIGRFATLDDRTLARICAGLVELDPAVHTTLLNLIERRLRTEAPTMFVPLVEGLMTWWDRFDEPTRDQLIDRLTPILNTEILRDFTVITPEAFERTTNAIANAPQMPEQLRRTLIRELVPHSRDLAARQPVAPPLVARLLAEDADRAVVDHVLENANALDPLAAAGFLLNVIELLKSSSLRFVLAEKLIAAYGDWDIVRRAATIDILGREMWRFLGYTDPSPIEVEGLAEASEPFVDVFEIELVEQLRTEIDALRLLSFPRV